MNADQTKQASTALAPAPRPGLIQSMASNYNIEPAKFLGTLKATVMPKRQGGEPVPVSDEDLAAFCIVAHEYGLNPFLKEIHAFPNKSGGITPVVGVDGWASLMNRRPEFDGIEFEHTDEDGKPYSVTARIYIKGRSRPVQITEFFSECFRGTEPWKTMPRRMLRHKALKECARVAFGFAGITDEDEARDIIDVTPSPTPTTASTNTGTATAFRKAKPVTPTQTQPAEPAPNPPPPADPPPQDPAVLATPQAELAGIVVGAGFTIDAFNRWAVAEGLMTAEAGSFDDVPTAVAAKLVRAKVGMLSGIRAEIGGAQ